MRSARFTLTVLYRKTNKIQELRTPHGRPLAGCGPRAGRVSRPGSSPVLWTSALVLGLRPCPECLGPRRLGPFPGVQAGGGQVSSAGRSWLPVRPSVQRYEGPH